MAILIVNIPRYSNNVCTNAYFFLRNHSIHLPLHDLEAPIHYVTENLPSTIHTSLHFCYDYCSSNKYPVIWHMLMVQGKFKVVWIFSCIIDLRRTRTPSIVCQAGDRRGGPMTPLLSSRWKQKFSFLTANGFCYWTFFSFLCLCLVEINLFSFSFLLMDPLHSLQPTKVSYIFITLLYIFCLKEILTLRPLVPKHNDNYKVNRGERLKGVCL